MRPKSLGLLPLGAVCMLGGLAWESPPAVPAAQSERRSLSLRYGPEDRAGGRYQYVTIEVPEGARRLDIAYRYDRAQGENVVDLGLFEPGSLELGSPAYRGWSGGERAAITVGLDSATPGYWPGFLPPGRWHVMLGLYKVAVPGVEVAVDVEVHREQGSEGSPPALSSQGAGPLRPGPAWFSGDLHVHTVHSDGVLTAREAGRAAREAGLDFIAITDHNNTTHQLEGVEDDGLLRIVGEEVTTPGGHANVWGLGGSRDYVDFRIRPGDPRMAALVDGVRERGALFSINHPRTACAGCSWEHDVPAGVAAVEVWNGAHGAQAAALAFWDELLLAGRRLTGVGSSDWHRFPGPLGAASVRVWAQELSVPAILEGLRHGRVVVMADARTPPPLLSARVGSSVARPGETLTVRRGQDFQVELSAPAAAFEGGRVDLYWKGRLEASATLRADQTAVFSRKAMANAYLRAQIYAADGSLLALTNPIYLEVKRPR